MKTRVFKRELLSIIHFYNEQLAIHHGGRALTLAARERIRRGFEELQKEKQKMEKTNIWFIPYCVQFNSTGEYSVAIADESNILVID